jgi:FkbM family methyltransferase
MKTLIFLLLLTSAPCIAESVVMGLIIKHNDSTIPAFLEKISALDYDKKKISVHIDVLNDKALPKLLKWCDENHRLYQSMSWKKSCETTAKTKEAYLRASKDFDLVFIVPSDVFLNRFTLTHLANKQLPVVAPLLRPLPKAGDPYRNFYLTATQEGYYASNSEETEIADRRNIGTFKADCVHGAHLIRTKYLDKLSFLGKAPWSFIDFSNTARKNNVDQYICNEREFGFLLHNDITEDVALPFLSENITREKVQSLVKTENDPELVKYLDSFPIEVYSLYPVENDLYWVDEKWDWVKGHYIKKGLRWEPHIEAVFKQYVNPGDTVIDIGGHIGTHSINLSRLVGATGTVHVFEPQSKLYTELSVNTAINSCNNVKAYRFALGQEEKTVEIVHPCSTNEGMACIGQGGEKVTMKRLDDFGINNVSLIKIDIEGHEIEAIKGGLETIKKSKPVIIVEVFRGPECDERLMYLRSLGYQVTHLEDNDYLCLPL